MSWLGVPATPTEHPWRWGAIIGVTLTGLGMAVCMTLLFFAMRGVMDLGGFVARGGPYEIAHPAPAWIWLLPVSIVSGMMLGFANAAFAARAGGFKLAIPAWSALFLSLGWNFAEYGVDPPGGGGVVWGWVVCAVVFLAMGAAPLLLWLGVRWTIVERVRSQLQLRSQMQRLRSPAVVGPDTGGLSENVFRRRYLVVNAIAVLAGGALGVLLFSAVAG